jgi:(E)-4-hydroxy-3-methylbut-2-enyl-diphosphate synthase
LFEIVDKVEKALMSRITPVKLAIMGCVVNGPGEAREADIGIAGGNGIGILFKKGKVVKKFPQDRLVDVVLEAVDAFEKQAKSN